MATEAEPCNQQEKIVRCQHRHHRQDDVSFDLPNERTAAVVTKWLRLKAEAVNLRASSTPAERGDMVDLLDLLPEQSVTSPASTLSIACRQSPSVGCCLLLDTCARARALKQAKIAHLLNIEKKTNNIDHSQNLS